MNGDAAPPSGQDRASAAVAGISWYLAGFALFALALPARTGAWALAADVAYLPFRTVTTVLLALAARSTTDRDIARAFWLLTVAQGFTVIGNLTWVFSDIVSAEPENWVYLSWGAPATTLTILGLAGLLRNRGVGAVRRLTDWTDAAVLVVAGALCAWYLAAEALAGGYDGDPEGRALFIAESTANVLTAMMASAVWLRAPAGLARGVGPRLAVAFAMLAVGDLLFNVQLVAGAYRSGSLLDVWYATAVVVTAWAAQRQYRHPDGDPLPDSTRANRGDAAVFGAVALALVPPVIEIGRARGNAGALATTTFGIVLLMLLVLVRQRLARAEIEKLVAARLRLEHQLWQAQKLDAIGRLAGGIAHDFNNILAVISSHAQLLRSRAGERRDNADLAEIEFATERAAVLVRRLLTFATAGSPAHQPVVVSDVVTQMHQMLRQLLVSGVSLDLQARDDAATVVLADGQLEQVVLNLTVNARDATPPGGVVAITTSRVRVATRDALHRRGLAPGNWVLIEVSDTGSGMDDQTREHIFEPFFTTKDGQGGTGLGLATVAGIVEAAQGHVHVESAPGSGTTMRVYFPQGPDVGGTHGPSAPAARRASHNGTLLVVDDELPIRSALARYLGNLGYTVLEAADVAQGMSLLEQHEWRVDLVLTDVRMPDQTGIEMAARVRARQPAIPVLFMTGQPGGAPAGAATPPRGDTIDKPFDLDAVAERVRMKLAEAAAPG